MKKVVLVVMMFTVMFSCKDDKTTQTEPAQNVDEAVSEDGKTNKQSDGLIAIHGKFYTMQMQLYCKHLPKFMVSSLTTK